MTGRVQILDITEAALAWVPQDDSIMSVVVIHGGTPLRMELAREAVAEVRDYLDTWLARGRKVAHRAAGGPGS